MQLPLSKYVWFDGKYVMKEKATVPITTHAIHYGTSIFEGIRAYWNGNNLNIFRVNEHVKRFRKSGQFYSVSLNFSDEEIIAQAMEKLRLMYGDESPPPASYQITRWIQDPFARGSYSFPAVGMAEDARKTLAEPIANRVFFAGEATNADYPATVHGAYLSGLREADRIFELIEA